MYIGLNTAQRLTRSQARFKDLLVTSYPDLAKKISEDELDTFLKNAHHLRVLRGKQWGAWDKEPEALGRSLQFLCLRSVINICLGAASSLQIAPRETATHLALNALSTLLSVQPGASE